MRHLPGLIVLVALLGVLWLSLAPSPLPNGTLQALLGPFDHILLYVGVTVVLCLKWPDQIRRVATLALSLAVLLELGQGLVPVRAYETKDLVANIVGVVTGLLGFGLIRKFRRFP